jgi:hypothetical protein
LRYVDALDYGEMNLELDEEKFRINTWTKMKIDVVASLDAREDDPTIFGSLKV